MMKSGEKRKTVLQDLAIIAGGLLGIGGLLLVLRKIGVFVMGHVLAVMLAAFSGESYDLLFTSTSPSGEYVLEALCENTPAIEPFYVKVNLLDGEENRTVYYVRGQDDAEIIWLSDTVAQINGVPVDVTSGEYFTANARGYFDVMVTVKAADVEWMEMTVCMDREPRVTRSRTGVLLADPADAWGLSPRLNVLKELQWDDDLSKEKAGLTVTLRTVNGQEIILPYIWEWTADVYGNYAFTLTGSAAWGYTLTPEFGACAMTRIEETAR